MCLLAYSFNSDSQFLLLSLPLIRRRDLYDEAGENVVGIVDMRVLLDDVRIAALVADGVQRLALADDVYLVAGRSDELVPAQPPNPCVRVRPPQRAEEDDRHQRQSQVPGRRVCDRYDRRRRRRREFSW